MGKYLDVLILMRLADFHGLIWENKVEMLYRIHGNNDGLNENTRDRLKLICKIRAFEGRGSHHSLNGLRQITYKNWLHSNGIRLSLARQGKIVGLLSALRKSSKLSWRYWFEKTFKTYVCWRERRRGF